MHRHARTPVLLTALMAVLLVPVPPAQAAGWCITYQGHVITCVT